MARSIQNVDALALVAELKDGDRVARLFSAWWVESLRLLNARVMRLRTGKINHYVLFALAFLALVFLLSVLNLI